MAACALGAIGLTAPAFAELELNKGDRICFIGNNLADRMQHDGWLETLIQTRFPEHELVFRNLGFTADEVNKRPRSQNFRDEHSHLAESEADVIFCFFGYNESYKDNPESFAKDLRTTIEQMRKMKYNGESAPKIVLFSPIAHEDLKSPHLPDGSENNARLAKYTSAMAAVAKEAGVEYVDLFAPSKAEFAKSADPLTMNGIHLTTEGNRYVAQVIDEALFGAPKKVSEKQLAKLRAAVVDKNYQWFNKYRTTDGYNVYGGRSKLNWDGISNADVMKVEMQMFAVRAANRDKRVWAIAQGKDLEVKDDNLPEAVKVPSNRKNMKPVFKSGEAAIADMTVHSEMEVNLFASEEQFPELINPVQMAVDTDGRLWAAVWPTYPHWNPRKPLNDKLVILKDNDNDGKCDELVPFAENLNSITGFEFWGGGVLVAVAPEILFLKDTDGDDRADVTIRMLQGVTSADSHHTANGLVIGPAGNLYWSRGVFHVANMETPTKVYRSTSSGVYKFDPRTFEIDFHFPIGPNPHGNAFDAWGFQYATDGTSGTGDYIAIGRGQRAPHRLYKKRVRPVPASGILGSSHFGEFEDNFLICNSITRSAFSACCSISSTTTVPISRWRSSSPSWYPKTRISVRRTWRSAVTAPCTCPTGKTRLSATCSTTCASRCVITPTVASTG
jgi:lysophospholipase L1-like esterase